MTPSISNPVGTRFVATWSPNRDGWEIKRYRPGESGQPVSAEQYVNDLPGQLDLSAIRRFLDHPSPMAVFERHHNGKVETVGIKLVPWFTDPVLLVQTLTTRTIGTDIASAHPELARRRWAKADTRVVPRSDDVDELIQSDRLLGAARRIH